MSELCVLEWRSCEVYLSHSRRTLTTNTQASPPRVCANVLSARHPSSIQHFVYANNCGWQSTLTVLPLCLDHHVQNSSSTMTAKENTTFCGVFFIWAWVHSRIDLASTNTTENSPQLSVAASSTLMDRSRSISLSGFYVNPQTQTNERSALSDQISRTKS